MEPGANPQLLGAKWLLSPTHFLGSVYPDMLEDICLQVLGLSIIPEYQGTHPVMSLVGYKFKLFKMLILTNHDAVCDGIKFMKTPQIC